MTTSDPVNGSTLAVVSALKAPLQQWVRGWMLTDDTARRGVALGLRDLEQFWIVGRAGVLGDGPADVAIGGLAFLGPQHVREAWEGLPVGLGPRAVAEEYAACAAEWGDRELPRFGVAALARLDRLGRRVVDAADPSLGLVFAGWRAMPAPTSPAARVALTMHVLRELRGAAHVVAIHACGLTPLQAVLSSPAPAPRTGPAWAEHLGWTGPFPDGAQFRRLRDEAEALTNRILVPAFEALAPDELAELADLCTSVRNAIDM
jgi:hypothetical protein